MAAFWNCNVPEAETIVDMSVEQAQEEIQIERLAPEIEPNETMAVDKSATTQEELVGSADANCAQIDRGDREQVDAMEGAERQNADIDNLETSTYELKLGDAHTTQINIVDKNGELLSPRWTRAFSWKATCRYRTTRPDCSRR